MKKANLLKTCQSYISGEKHLRLQGRQEPATIVISENFKTDVHGNHAWVDMRLTDRRADVQLYVSKGPGLKADQEHYGLLLGRHFTPTVPLSILGLNGYQ